jgi:deoxyribodipyrimidine photolyase-related protein
MRRSRGLGDVYKRQVFGLKRLTDLPELKVRAQEVLKGLDKGII